MITIKKEKTEKEALTLFSVEIALAQNAEDKQIFRDTNQK